MLATANPHLPNSNLLIGAVETMLTIVLVVLLVLGAIYLARRDRHSLV